MGSVAEVARVGGLPRRSVHNVIEGVVPSVDRADEICRALGISMRIGAALDPIVGSAMAQSRAGSALRSETVTPLRPAGEGSGGSALALEPSAAAPAMEPVRDRLLAELLARLADHWEALGTDVSRREHLATAVAASLTLSGERERGPRYRALSGGSAGGS